MKKLNHKSNNKSWSNEKSFKIDIKSINDDGTFKGYASVYGNTDLANESVQPGAFKRTLDHNKVITLLWQHDTKQPIGIGYLEDEDKGLKIKGEINLEVAKGKEAFSLLKQKAIKGLSIGYDVVKDKYDKGIRLLTELKLWEVSVVTFPCNEEASVIAVKKAEKELVEKCNKIEEVKDFNTELAQRDLRENKWQMESAFNTAVYKVIDNEELDITTKIATISIIFDQYKSAFISWLGQILQVTQTVDNQQVMMKSIDLFETKDTKVGKPVNANRLGKLKNAISILNALLKEIEPSDDSSKSNSDDEEIDIKGLSLEDIVNQMKLYTTDDTKNKQEINILEGINIDNIK